MHMLKRNANELKMNKSANRNAIELAGRFGRSADVSHDRSTLGRRRRRILGHSVTIPSPKTTKSTFRAISEQFQSS